MIYNLTPCAGVTAQSPLGREGRTDEPDGDDGFVNYGKSRDSRRPVQTNFAGAAGVLHQALRIAGTEPPDETLRLPHAG